MPDHLHLLWMGRSESSDQIRAASFLRRAVNRLLHPEVLQKQGYDHVLREKDRDRNAFQRAAYYILENPVRAGLVERAEQYGFSGCMAPGYPELDVHAAGHWDLFWRLMEQ
jgi:putative transposase